MITGHVRAARSNRTRTHRPTPCPTHVPSPARAPPWSRSAITSRSLTPRRGPTDMNVQKITTTVLAGIVVAGALTACTGSSDDGEYIRHDGSRLMTLVIDGSDVTHDVLDCDDSPVEEQSVGELDDTGTMINWVVSEGDFDSSDGTFDARSEVTITETTVVIPYTVVSRGYDAKDERELVYHRADSEAGERVRAEHQQECADG